MRNIAVLFIHLLATILKLIRPGGTRSVVAESLLLKHQLLILNRSRQRAPNLKLIDRVIAGMCVGLVRPARLVRSEDSTYKRPYVSGETIGQAATGPVTADRAHHAGKAGPPPPLSGA